MAPARDAQFREESPSPISSHCANFQLKRDSWSGGQSRIPISELPSCSLIPKIEPSCLPAVRKGKATEKLPGDLFPPPDHYELMSPFPVLRDDPHACALGEGVLLEQLPGWPPLWGVDFRLSGSSPLAVFRLESLYKTGGALIWKRVA